MAVFWIFIILQFNLILQNVNSQMIFGGPCPEKSINQTIRLRRVSGAWYEIERSSVLKMFPLKCVTLQIQQFFNGEAEAKMTSINAFTNKKQEDRSKVKVLPNVRQNGQFSGLIPGIPPDLKVQILATDFDKYALLWACSTNGHTISHSESLWVFGRHRKFRRSEIERIVSEHIKHFGLTNLKLQPTSHLGCQV